MTDEEKRIIFDALAILVRRTLYPNLADNRPVDLEKDRRTLQLLVAHLNKLDDEGEDQR